MTNTFEPHAFLKTVPDSPGVYQMQDAAGLVLYVGKAKSLKKRLASYFMKTAHPKKTAVLVKKIVNIQIILTETEVEALLLEQTLIKQKTPRYNVSLRDDKSYPYLVLTQHAYPRLHFYRGEKKNKQHVYYGPYPSASAAKTTLHTLQNIFKLRSCTDSYFKRRQRPCLQYQIKKCSAPCVNYIASTDYHVEVERVKLFLSGRDEAALSDLQAQMQKHVENLAFELAAKVKEKIKALTLIRMKQMVVVGEKDVDVVYLLRDKTQFLMQCLYIRQGKLLGERSYFLAALADESDAEMMAAFLPQHYLANDIPPALPTDILVSCDFSERKSLAALLSKIAQRKIHIKYARQSANKAWMALAQKNARYALLKKNTENIRHLEALHTLQSTLNLPTLPKQIECFDISHTFGEATTGGCVVFKDLKLLPEAYRRFNIEAVKQGDDYAAMHQAVYRHYAAYQETQQALPDVLLIDGGKGQCRAALEALKALAVQPLPAILGIAKGISRKPGLETLHFSGRAFHLSQDSALLRLLQHIRDAAHHFALTGHRKRRAKKISSVLEKIPGIGPAKRQALLLHFSDLDNLRQANVEALLQVKGINKDLAQRIVAFLSKESNF